MEKNLTKLSFWCLILAAILTLIAAFIPLWRIDLAAPQYPEGLVLFIGGLSGVDGDLYKINELNHYVGMAQIHPGDFWEFTVLPILLCVFAVLFAVTAFIKSKKMTIIDFVLFCIFAVLGFIDFYRWTYVYGHNLSPDAAIKVPGMAYQPPVIGYKKLLNFEAFSQPDFGGYLLVVAGILIALAVFKETGILDKVLGIFKKSKA